MTQIVRYVVESNDKYTIEESFIDFITTTKKTGQGLAEEILKKLSEDGLEFKNCRGQGYDNGANMAGKIKGVQSRLQEINKHAQFCPCTAHSLNLVGAHASRVSVRMLKYVIQALQHISENSEFGDGFSGAQSLLGLINVEFVYLLVMWDSILNQVYKVNITLQKSNISISNASKIVMGLKNALEEMRNEGSENINILKMSGEQASDSTFTIQQELKLEYNQVMDTLISQISWRFEALSNNANDFEFLSGFHLNTLSIEDLKKHAADLVLKYSSDLNSELLNEIECFKYQGEAIIPNLKMA
ncbi:uncharacterized protein LOC132953444 [Metopolophium dirhodum]|uniref:uncharacterized protein LOC132933048 n=1 Tax=Metopolophium dirhodum TaxID=44670 RepID=UPI00298FD7E7|nr:uncharacterized protein LOC132933048 [Metopolophium dirhodum]XP_060881853.1 uncharacterized protein LOC132953444 [Metopolophium dirhodum]